MNKLNLRENCDNVSKSPPHDCIENGDAAMKVIYVCIFCFREYGLEEDLRGHLIEYHKCTPIDNHEHDTMGSIQDKSEKINVLDKVDAQNCERLNQPEAIRKNDLELRPVPFRDFRIILRSKMIIRCSVTYSCVFKFENSTKLEMHEKCHKDQSDKQFKCFSCNAEFSNWRRCSAHLWKDHELDIDLLHCPLVACDYKANASVLVWRHMRAHKKWRPRVIRSMHAVQEKHKRNEYQHSNQVEPIKSSSPQVQKKNKYYSEKTCEICQRKFKNGKTLSKHVKTVHNKLQPFICNVCGKKTARKACLVIHMRQHTGEKPLKCKFCKFATRDPSALSKHEMRHEKVGRFKCKVCDYSCIQSSAYKRHLSMKHPEEYRKIACDLCSFVTVDEHRLLVHKEDHRKGLITSTEDTPVDRFQQARKIHDKNNENYKDCFLQLESSESLPHEPAVDTGGVTIPAPPDD